MTVRAFLDANVLYPATLRSLLIDLSLLGVYRAHWSDAVQDEWTRKLRINRPDLDPARVQRTRDLMDAALDEARVSGYEPLLSTLSLPDPLDVHVLAAAMHVQAEAIVTINLSDFPPDMLEPHGLQAIHPDAFLTGLVQSHRDGVWEALHLQSQRYRQPPVTVNELLTRLSGLGLPAFVAAIRDQNDESHARPHP